MKKNLLKESARKSVILAGLRRMLGFANDSFDKSISGALLASGGNMSSLFGASAAVSLFAGQTRRNSPLKKLLRFVASGFEGSFFARLIKKGYAAFLNMKMRSAGFFLAAYSLFSIFALLILYFSDPEAASFADFVTVIVIAIISIPMMCSVRSVIGSISASRFVGPIFRKNYGVDTENKIREVSGVEFPERLSGFALVFGIIAGTLTVFVSPLLFTILVCSFLAVMFIIAIPEAGVISLIAAIPFYSIWSEGANIVFSLIAVTFIGYIGKLIRGKRVFNIGFMDVAVFALFAILFASCFGSAASYNKAQSMVWFVFTYFLFVNLIKNRVWLHRSAMALVFSWIIIAFIGLMVPIIQNTTILSDIFPQFGNTSEFFVFGVSGRAIYLLLPSIPFILTAAMDTTDMRKRAMMYVFAVLAFLCITVGGNSMPVTPFLIGMAVYVLCCAPMAVFVAIPVWLSYLALKGIRIPFLYDMMTASNDYAAAVSFENRYVRGGAVRALKDYIFTGIGMGDETFSKVYPDYSYAGFEGALDSGSSILDFILGCGIIGALIFVIVILCFMRETLGFVKNKAVSNRSDKRYVASALSGVVMLSVASFGDNIFATETVFLYLWIMIAFGVSYIRMGKVERERAEIRHPDTPDKVDMEMPYVSVRRTDG